MNRSAWFVLSLLTAVSAARAEAPAPGLRLIDAVRTSLRLDPQVRLQETVVAESRGGAESAAGAFDLSLIAHAGRQLDSVALDSLTSSQEGGRTIANTNTTTYGVGVAQLLPWGMTIAPAVEVTHIATSGSPNVGQARVVFSVVQPLLRGRGEAAVTSRLEAFRLLEEASQLELRDVVARRVSVVAQSYWAYAAAQHSLEILRRAEAWAALLLDQQRRLVAADEIPGAELKQVEANLAGAQAARAAGERAVVDAQQALGLAMGVEWTAIAALAPPADAFPSPPAWAPSDAQIAREVERAIAQRADRLAAQRAASAADLLVIGSRRGLDPQLDLRLDVGYAGLSEGPGLAPVFTPIADRLTGPNAFASIVYRFPLQNREARGALHQAQAGLERARIQLADLERVIGSNVATFSRDFALDLQVLASAERAVADYRDAVTSEQQKLRAGMSTLLDLLVTQERLTAAELNAVAAQARVAQDLAGLRYATGTLIVLAGEASSVGLDELTCPPPPP